MNNHIQNIQITNFKSIKDLKIDGCKKINIFAGKPNAGKSNILEAIGVFDLFKNNNSFYLKNYIRYSKFQDLFFEGNFNNHSHININKSGASFIIINKDLILTKRIDKKTAEFTKFDNNGFSFFEKNTHSFPETIRKYKFQELDNYSNEDLKHLLSPFGENISTIISSNSEIRNFVNSFLSQNNLKLLIERGSNDLKIFKEYEDGTVFSLPYSMIADTLQRLIFYKAAIMSNQNSVLLFEEPEAHCFEPYILEFTNEVKYNENDNQFFIVTHSDFIIQEFLRDEETRKDTQIYLVNNVDGKTEVKKLDAEKNEDVYEYNMNVFFNFDNLWETN